MEARKHVECDIVSSVETDHQSEKLINEEYKSGVGRAYECTFCKQGFTNAQALGGHMNMHRKDKAKVKKRNGEEPSNQSIKLVKKYFNSRCFSHVSSSDQGNQLVSHQRNIPVWRPEEQFIDYMKVNLNMRIGLPPLVDEEEGRISQESEVDLELRLGHDP